MKQRQYNPLHILCGNGWEWHHYNTDWLIHMDDTDEYDQYTLDILGGNYTTTVRAVVSSHSKHLVIDGCYGVLWLDAAKYECDPPHTIDAMKDMICAIDLAEENLLKIGMPFVPDYRFHSNKANRKRRNDKLRRLYNLEELEKKDREK